MSLFVRFVVAIALSVSLSATLRASTYGSVEPIANSAVLDTRLLSEQPLNVRKAFATRLMECGIVSRVARVLSSTGAITTLKRPQYARRRRCGRLCRAHESLLRVHDDRRRPQRRERGGHHAAGQ